MRMKAVKWVGIYSLYFSVTSCNNTGLISIWIEKTSGIKQHVPATKGATGQLPPKSSKTFWNRQKRF